MVFINPHVLLVDGTCCHFKGPRILPRIKLRLEKGPGWAKNGAWTFEGCSVELCSAWRLEAKSPTAWFRRSKAWESGEVSLKEFTRIVKTSCGSPGEG